MNNRLYIGNLAYSTRDEDLRELFAAYGEVVSARVMMDRDTGRSKGFAFVEMSNETEAQAAIRGLHDQQVGGRPMVVNAARPREERPAFGGGGNRRY